MSQFTEGLWLIGCDGNHEWVAGPHDEAFFSCPVCGAEDEALAGIREMPDGTERGVIA